MANDLVVEKITSIRQSGKKAYEEGTVKLFTGFSENLKSRFNLSALITQKMGCDLTRYIIGIDNSFQTDGYLPVLDFPIHTTILEAVWEAQEKDCAKLFAGMKKEALPIAKKAGITEVMFSDIVLDGGGSVLLMADHIPDNILELRYTLTELYKKRGLRVLPMENILHSTLLRIRKLPANVSNFCQEVECLPYPYGPKGPKPEGGFLFWVKKFYIGSAWDLLTIRDW